MGEKKEHLTAAHVLMPLDPSVVNAKYWLQEKMLAGAPCTFAKSRNVLMPLDPSVINAKYWLQDKMLAGARVTIATSMKHRIRNAARQNGKKKKKKKEKERKKEKKKEHLTAAHVLM